MFEHCKRNRLPEPPKLVDEVPQEEVVPLLERNEIFFNKAVADELMEIHNLKKVGKSLILVMSCGETRTPGEICVRQLIKHGDETATTKRVTMGSRIINDPIRKMSYRNVMETTATIFLVPNMGWVKEAIELIQQAGVGMAGDDSSSHGGGGGGGGGPPGGPGGGKFAFNTEFEMIPVPSATARATAVR